VVEQVNFLHLTKLSYTCETDCDSGAGKSSLVMAFFRLVEFAGGSVIIDGVNISNIGK
jgi:hypothetical protein